MCYPSCHKVLQKLSKTFFQHIKNHGINLIQFRFERIDTILPHSFLSVHASVTHQHLLITANIIFFDQGSGYHNCFGEEMLSPEKCHGIHHSHCLFLEMIPRVYKKKKISVYDFSHHISPGHSILRAFIRENNFFTEG